MRGAGSVRFPSKVICAIVAEHKNKDVDGIPALQPSISAQKKSDPKRRDPFLMDASLCIVSEPERFVLTPVFAQLCARS